MKPSLKISLWIWLPGIFIVLLLLHARHYMPFFSDDSLISLRYAHQLLHGQGLRWTDGQPVEGYSNLLWILLVALLGAFKVDLIDAARILGLLFMSAVVVFAGFRYLNAKRAAVSFPAFIVGMIFFVGAAPTAVWAIGGLEQPLVAAALAAVVILYWIAADEAFQDRALAFKLSIPLAILCLARPDGPLFTLGVIASVLFSGLRVKAQRKSTYTFALIALSAPVISFLGQLAFRIAYYGEWIPNPALVKLTPSMHHFLEGISYVLQGIVALSPASYAAIVLIGVGLFYRASRKRFVLLATMLLLWIVYLAVIGGDIFPAYRHFVPVVVLFAFALSEGTVVLLRQLGDRVAQRNIVTVILISIAASTFVLQFNNAENRRAITERWEWQGRALALTLKQAFSEERPTIAVTAAGCLPYWSEFPSLDMLGLNDHFLPRHKPKDIGSGFLGHELGNGDYILRSAPDLIVFNVGSAPSFRVGRELDANKQFHRQYKMVRVRTAYPPRYTAFVWFRIDSRAVGYQRNDDRLTIPAYLMTAYPSTIAFLDQRNNLVVSVDKTHRVGVALKHVPGDYEVEVVSPYSQQIEVTTRPRTDGDLLILTTKSASRLPIEAIVISEPQ